METIPTHRPYRTRTWVLFAAEAPVAVILRRRPRKAFRLIRWNLRHDTFEPGQWLGGDVKLCDLSADGLKLLCFVAQRHRAGLIARCRLRAAFDPLHDNPVAALPKNRKYRRVPRYLRADPKTGGGIPRAPSDTWTALSMPPYFTALAVWPAVGTWTGGGVFVGKTDIVLFENESGLTPIANVPMPTAWRVRPPRADDQSLVRSADAPAYGPAAPGVAETWAALVTAGAPNLDWLAVHADGDLLFANDGAVYRVREWRRLKAADLLAHARQLIDLNDMRFEQMAPSEDALRW